MNVVFILDSTDEMNVVFILDSTDEMKIPDPAKAFQLHTLAALSGFGDPSRWPHAKVVISCRPEYLNAHKLTPDESLARDATVAHIQPWDPVQVRRYIGHGAGRIAATAAAEKAAAGAAAIAVSALPPALQPH
eukprot:gene51619-56301_t